MNDWGEKSSAAGPLGTSQEQEQQMRGMNEVGEKSSDSGPWELLKLATFPVTGEMIRLAMMEQEQERVMITDDQPPCRMPRTPLCSPLV